MTAEQQPIHHPHIVVQGNRPLIGVLTPEQESDAMTYFTDEDSADQTVTDATVEEALALAGAWSDVRWDEIESVNSEERCYGAITCYQCRLCH